MSATRYLDAFDHEWVLEKLSVVNGNEELFQFIDGRKNSKDFNKLQTIVLSQQPFFRLTVPPMFWFGFKGLADGVNLISNQADLEHDPDEVDRRPLGAFDVDWGISL